ncbi:MAG: beta-hydroxyacyl-ACP dehydratase, partial [Thermoanaerobaculia bacterium]
MRIEIPRDSPFFAGHFPGHPILPGIAHLALAAGGRPLAEVRTLKLRKPVLPGDVLDLSLEEAEGLVRFEIRKGEETA